MRAKKPVIMAMGMLSLLGGIFLASELPLSPTQWMQGVVLNVLGVSSPAIAHATPPPKEGLSTGSPIHLAKVLGRPAGKKGESWEEKELGELGKPIPPGQVRKRSKAELLDKCNKQPRCRAKLQAAQKSKGKRPSKNVRSAGKEGESPEEKALSKLPKPDNPKPRGSNQRSEFRLSEENTPLLSWLNPFSVAPAYAQSAFSQYFTPENRYSSSPYGYITLFGASYWGSWYLYGTGFVTMNATNSENKPYVYLLTTIPSEGWYLVNFEAGRGKAKVRHRSSGPIIETWDFTSQSCNPCDYLTAEYLTAGSQYFYFWPDNSSMYFYSASIDAY